MILWIYLQIVQQGRELGWTGDAQLYCRTASDFMNVYTFFEKWMTDVAAEQFANGSVGSTVPNVLGYHNPLEYERNSKRKNNPMMAIISGIPDEAGVLDGSVGWGDATVIISWTMYLCYGDKSILEQQFDSAKAWVDYMDNSAKTPNEHYKDLPAYQNYTDGEIDANYIWDTKFHWGEWMEADFKLEDYGEEWFSNQMKTSDPLVATAFYAYSTRLLSEMAGVLGKKEDEEKYRKLYEKVRRVYNKYFIQDNGLILKDRQA